MSSPGKLAIVKVGGSVFKNIGCYPTVADYIAGKTEEGYTVWPVVSAPKDWTTILNNWHNEIRKKALAGESVRTRMGEISDEFRTLAKPFLERYPAAEEAYKLWRQAMELCRERVHVAAIVKGTGERFSGLALQGALCERSMNYAFFNGHEYGVVLVDNGEGEREGRVLIDESLQGVGDFLRHKIRTWEGESPWRAVFGGYVGIDPYGDALIMERDATDGSAAVIAASAKRLGYDPELILMKESQILRADPNLIESPAPIERMSYAEAYLLTTNGYRVVYPPAIQIAQGAEIPIRVNNFESQERFTVISTESGTTHEYPIAAVVINRNRPGNGYCTVVAIGEAMGPRPGTLGALGTGLANLGESPLNVESSSSVRSENHSPELMAAAEYFIVESELAEEAARRMYEFSLLRNPRSILVFDD